MSAGFAPATGSSTGSVPCLNPGCVEQFNTLRRDLEEEKADRKKLGDRVQALGERISSVESRVAGWAAFGALLGGGIVTLLARLVH